MSMTQEIPAEIIADAHEIWAMAQLGPNEGIVDGVDRVARALLARDTATRKECAQIARRIDNECGMEAGLAAACAEAIEATIGGAK